MKAVFLTMSCMVLIYNHQAQADMLGLTLTGDYSKLSLSGRAGDQTFSQPLQFSDDDWQSWSVAFEHPLPLLPNIALRRQTATWSGNTQLDANLRLDQYLYSRQSKINNSFDFQSTDLSFYYEVLDNSLLAFDVGITAMVYDAGLAVTEPAKKRSVSGVLPLLYGNVTVHVWGTDTALFGQAHYTDYHHQQWTQSKIGVAYQFLDLTALLVSVKLGWQHQSIILTGKDQLDMDFRMDGPFLALEADF